MNTETERAPAKPTGRRYESVEVLLRAEGVSQGIRDKLEELKTDTKVALQLAKLRQKAGITQEEMANHMGLTQPTISKLESGLDEDITLKHVREYVRVTGQRIGVMFGKPLSHAESIKMLAHGLKFHLESLAEIAKENDELQEQIKNFFGEAFFNLFNIMASCNDKIPNGENDVEIRVEIVQCSKLSKALPRLVRRDEGVAV